jgi:PIN domain nuclease of toxin-antitoxin system
MRPDSNSALSLIQHALPLAWTRDPFDRLLAAHSIARRMPLCSADVQIRKTPYLPGELVP